MPRKKLTCVTACWTVLAVMAGSALAETSPGDCPSPDNAWRCGTVTRMADALARGGAPRGAGDPQPESPNTDVLHTKIDIEVDPAAGTVFGTVTISVRSMIDGLTEFVVYLSGGGMSVTSVAGNVAGPTSFSRVGDKVTVTLDTAYDSGQAFTVSLDYGGGPSGGGIYWDSYWNGSQTVYIAATLSEPFYARAWWVGKDVLDDKCTFDIWVTVADPLVVVSNGVLQGVDVLPGNMLRYRWGEINPMIPYLASLAIADYDLYSTTYNHLGDVMPMAFYMLKGYNTPSWRGYCDEYVTMTEVFSDVYGQYPFVNEKGGMAHTPMLWAFMEHQTIPSMPTFSYSWVNSHELAHQWWGDNVTCETWGDIWLNEGITSFSEAIWEEFKPGGSAAAYHAHMAGRWPSSTDSLVYVTDVNSESAIFASTVYDKGAWVTHMLRHVLGDATFFQALLDYRTAHSGSSATTAEFIASISATAGYDLSFFTDQWVMNPGSPDYEYAWQAGQAGSQDFLLLRVAQTQGNRGYGLMTMPIDVRVTTNLSTTTYVVWCIDTVETYAIPLDGAPTQVVVDPDNWILTHSLSQVAPGVIAPLCQGDMNEDGAVNGLDIQLFVDSMLDPATWPSAWRRMDMNFDGAGDAADVPLFVGALLGNPGCP